MSEPKLPEPASTEWYAEEERHIAAIRAWLQRWPNFRKTAAYGALGAAVAFADLMGIDVEAFIKGLRDKGCTQRTSGILVPPRSS